MPATARISAALQASDQASQRQRRRTRSRSRTADPVQSLFLDDESDSDLDDIDLIPSIQVPGAAAAAGEPSDRLTRSRTRSISSQTPAAVGAVIDLTEESQYRTSRAPSTGFISGRNLRDYRLGRTQTPAREASQRSGSPPFHHPRLRRTSSHHPMSFPNERTLPPPSNYRSVHSARTYHNPAPPHTHVSPLQVLKRPARDTDSADGENGSNKKRKSEGKPAEILDLVDLDDDESVQQMIQRQRHEMLKQQAAEGERRRRIADFKCVICLDDPDDLSVTTCGHLFCNLCLKTSLRHGQPSAKIGKCPVCRGKVAIKDILPLELKLTTRSKKGKEKANA